MSAVLPVFRRSIRESWKGLIGWSLGIAGVLFMYLSIYPSIGATGQLEEVISAMPKQLIDTLGYDQIATGAGYVQGTFFGLLGFVLTTIAAVGWGSDAVAGAEESGRLELDIAHGIGRAQYVIESVLSILVRMLCLGLVACVVILALNEPSQLALETVRVFGASASLIGLAMLTATAGVAAGALTGRKVVATAAAAGLAVTSYVLQAVARQSADLEPLSALSPFHWVYGEPPLQNGPSTIGLLSVWGIAALLTVLAAVTLRQRDLRG